MSIIIFRILIQTLNQTTLRLSYGRSIGGNLHQGIQTIECSLKILNDFKEMTAYDKKDHKFE